MSYEKGSEIEGSVESMVAVVKTLVPSEASGPERVYAD